MFFKLFVLLFVAFGLIYLRITKQELGVPLKLIMLYLSGYCVYTFIVI